MKVSGSIALSVSGGVASFINGASFSAVAWAEVQIEPLQVSVTSAEETETGRSKSFSASWSYATDVSAQNLQSSSGETVTRNQYLVHCHSSGTVASELSVVVTNGQQAS